MLRGEKRDTNPYRDDPRAAEAGRDAFAEHCARCHAPDKGGATAPDLRRLDRYCRRIEEGILREACRNDVDHYFMSSVLKGKVLVGVVQMPSWKGVLSPEQIWAIRTYIEPDYPPGNRR
jgi:mono/diheme cytochrome c family protein